MPGYHRLRLPETYRALTSLDARGIAWEWLRRNPEFRALWSSAGPADHRASSRAEAAILHSRRTTVDLPQHPFARRWSPWGLTFRAAA